MREFLDLISPQDFHRLVSDHFKVELGEDKVEIVGLTECLGRVMAEDVVSPVDLPAFDRSTVDGYAVMASDTAGVSESLPGYLEVVGEVQMGEESRTEIRPGQCVKIATGGMLPQGANAVIMVEHTDVLPDGSLEFTSSVAPGENVIRRGEDIRQGEILFKKGHVLRPQDIGALAGIGITCVKVYERPRIALISTGDELVPPDVEPGIGKVRDINTYSIGAMIESLGCEARRIGIVNDDFSVLARAIRENFDCDMILISGGSSKGTRDIAVSVLNSLGKPGVLVHGVAIKPGKPTIFAIIDGIPVFGLPGHPASALTVFSTLVKPVILRLKGEADAVRLSQETHRVKAVLSRNLASDKGREEYVPVRLRPLSSGEPTACESPTAAEGPTAEGEVQAARAEHLSASSLPVEHAPAGQPSGLRYAADPIPGKSAMITPLAMADGVIKIGINCEGLPKGTVVDVELF